MLHEYTGLIKELRTKDSHFDALVQKHDALNDKVDDKSIFDKAELDKLKKEKLHLKDLIYAEVLRYKNSL